MAKAKAAPTTGPTPIAGERVNAGHERRYWILAILSLSLLIIGLDNTILNVALPTLQEEFNSTASELQWMVDAYILVFAGLLLTLGALGDRFGRAKALQAGLSIFALASLWAAFAPSAGQLISARAVMGIGGALIMPATLSIIINVFPEDERGRAISIWAGVAGLGIGLGPLIGGLLLEYFWWGSVFLINVPIAVIAIIAGALIIPESRDPDATALDIPGGLLSMGAVSALVYAIIEAPTKGWLDPLVVGAFALAIVFGALFTIRELRIDAPMLDFGFFRNLRFTFGAASIGFAFFALFGVIFMLTQYLQFVHGYSALGAGIRLVPIALGVMAGASQSHRWVRRFGTKRVVTVALLGLAIVMTSLWFWNVDTEYWIIGVTLFFMTAMMGNVMAPATESVMSALPEAKAGVGSAMNDLVRQVAGALGVAIIGSVLNVVYSNRMEDAVASLPPEAAGPAGDSVGGALAVAARLGGPAGERLAVAGRESFVDAFGVGALIAAGFALVGAVLVARYLPSHQTSTEVRRDAPVEIDLLAQSPQASTE